MKAIKKEQKNKRNYKICWNYLKESKAYFLVAFCLFIFSILIGFFVPAPQFLADLIQKFIKELVEKTAGMNFYQLLIFILQNNITTAFFGLIFGLVLGLIPLLLTVFNGYVLGYVAGKTAGILGYIQLLRLLPHGIFEIPALILSLGLGLKLGMFVFARKPKLALIYNLENSLRVFLYVILPLLLIAGVIETLAIFVLK